MCKLFFFLFYRGPLGPSPIEGIDKSSIYKFITRDYSTEYAAKVTQLVQVQKRTLSTDYDDECLHRHRHKSDTFFKENVTVPPSLPTLSFIKYEYHARLLFIPSDASNKNGDKRGKAKETCVVKDICSHNWTLVCICNGAV